MDEVSYADHQEKTTTSPKPIRMLFFWSGIIATFSYRIIIVLNFYNPMWVRVAWYVGTVGFIIYFIHRFRVTNRRAQMIRDHDLVKKVDMFPANEHDKEVMRYIFKSLSTSKERWNYVFVFTLSALALITGIILDFVV